MGVSHFYLCVQCNTGRDKRCEYLVPWAPSPALMRYHIVLQLKTPTAGFYKNHPLFLRPNHVLRRVPRRYIHHKAGWLVDCNNGVYVPKQQYLGMWIGTGTTCDVSGPNRYMRCVGSNTIISISESKHRSQILPIFCTSVKKEFCRRSKIGVAHVINTAGHAETDHNQPHPLPTCVIHSNAPSLFFTYYPVHSTNGKLNF